MARGKIVFGRLVAAYVAGREAVRSGARITATWGGTEVENCYMTGVRDERAAIRQAARDQQTTLDLTAPPLEQIPLPLETP